MRNTSRSMIDGEPTLQPQAFGIGELFWALREAVVVGDASSGRILLWNPAAEEMFGYSAGEAVGRPIELLVPRELKARHRAGIVHYSVTHESAVVGSRQTVELPAVRKDGTRISVELSLSPVASRLPGGPYVLAVIRDVTERRRAEEERSKREREHAARVQSESAMVRTQLLAQAGVLLVGALEHEQALASVAVLLVPGFAAGCTVDVVGVDGEVRRLAPALAGREHGRHPGDGSPGSDAGGARGLSEVLRSGEPLLLREPPSPDGAEGQSTIIVPLFARGRVLGAMTLTRDQGGQQFDEVDLAFAGQLGRLAGLALENTRLYRAAREAIQVRDEFLASASHELRTPVTTIKAYAQMLERRVAKLNPEDAQLLLEGLENIDDSASRLAVHISQLLDLSRLQAGGTLALDRSPTDLVGLARQAAAAHRRLSGRHRIRVKSAVPELTGLWDASRLERVLGNLLSNAVKFSPEGGEVWLVIAPAEGENGPEAILRIEDPGIGILPEDLPHVFERFYRGHNLTERMNGTGIGLAGAREIVRRHGGSIELESTAGGGTSVTVRLPLEPLPEPPPDEE
jgi:PAS domain S-box-containing protein